MKGIAQVISSKQKKLVRVPVLEASGGSKTRACSAAQVITAVELRCIGERHHGLGRAAGRGKPEGRFPWEGSGGACRSRWRSAFRAIEGTRDVHVTVSRGEVQYDST